MRISDWSSDVCSSDLQGIPAALARTSRYLTHPVFNRYHAETEMLRYLRRLQAKDIALDRSMIPLGSCTMNLNATTAMQRSEAHTSELQSLMRISYPVFCLKKNTTI